MRKKVTLKDIGEYCDLAPTTVSRILRDKETYCSAAKVEMVKRIAKEWDYQPNIGYHIMTGRNTNIAALIFSQFRATQDDQTHRLYMALSKGLDARDFASYTAVMDGDLDSQLRKLRALDERGCRYYIFLGTPSYYEQMFAFLERMKRFYAGFDNRFASRRVTPDRSGTYIKYCNIASGENLKNFRIAVTGNFFDTGILPLIAPEKRDEFRKAHLFEVPPMRMSGGDSCDYYYNLGKEIMLDALQKHPGLDGMAFTTDYHVFGAAEVLKSSGKSGEIKLFGMRDAVASRFVQYPFVTAHFDVELGANFILEHLSDNEEWEFILPGKLKYYR